MYPVLIDFEYSTPPYRVSQFRLIDNSISKRAGGVKPFYEKDLISFVTAWL